LDSNETEEVLIQPCSIFFTISQMDYIPSCLILLPVSNLLCVTKPSNFGSLGPSKLKQPTVSPAPHGSYSKQSKSITSSCVTINLSRERNDQMKRHLQDDKSQETSHDPQSLYHMIILLLSKQRPSTSTKTISSSSTPIWYSSYSRDYSSYQPTSCRLLLLEDPTQSASVKPLIYAEDRATSSEVF
jgi:hypothetical protein